MLQFESPEYLWFLLAIPVLGVAFLGVNLWRKRLLHRIVSKSLVNELAPDMSMGKQVMKQLCVLLSLAFLIITAANPQVGTRLEEVKREGIDLFVALDVSLSMKAEDIRPSRLEKAKRDVSSLLKKLQGDRVGLIVFAGDAFVQFPLTADYSAADLFISAVDVDAVPTPGTKISSAIDLALKSFSTDLPTQKAIIVVSDGENTEGDVTSSVESANKAGVKVFTVGMGTLEGGPIPLYDARGNRIDYKRDAAGSIVLTRLDETTLQQIAGTTAGSYRRATSGGNEINEIFGELSELEKTEFGVKQITGFESQFQYPLAAAILFLLIEFLLSERKGKIIRRIRKVILAAGVALAFVILGSSEAISQTVRSHIKSGNEAYREGKFADAEAEYKKAQHKDPSSREAQFNLGDSYYKQDRYDEALRSFNSAAASAKDAFERAASYHNIGNALYKAGKIQESIEAYKQALRLKPTDNDTRYNLQLAKNRLNQQENQQQNQQQNQDQQQQDRQQSQQQDQKQDQQQQSQRPEDQERQQREEQAKAAQQKHQIPKEQAERILEALRNNEKEIQKQLRKREGVRVKAEKDW